MAKLDKEAKARLSKEFDRAQEIKKSEKDYFKGWGRIFGWVIKPYMAIFHPMTYEGLENLPKEGSYLLSGNHQHALDIPLVHFTVTKRGRWITWVGKETLMKNAFTARFFPRLGVIPLNTEKPDSLTIKMIFKRIKEGNPIGIFPQGTRCETEEEIENTVPKSGAISFAHRMNIPIIPVGIVDEFRRFHKTKVIYGEPYYVAQDKKRLTNHEMMAETILLLEKSYALAGRDYPLKNKSELTGGILEDYKPEEN